MWCAARHCAFESHPLRHKRDLRKLRSHFLFWEILPVTSLFCLENFRALGYHKKQFNNKLKGA